jgi:hemin uptake protein HemP
MEKHFKRSALQAPASATTARSRTGESTRRMNTRELLPDGEDLLIEHNGREYRLRITKNGKLILTA